MEQIRGSIVNWARRERDRWPVKEQEELWATGSGKTKQDRAKPPYEICRGMEAFAEAMLEFLENTKVGMTKEGS